MPDDIGEMFYYGATPWHEKGNRLEQPANAEEAIKAGGLDWDVDLEPIQTPGNPPTAISRRMAVVRTDLRQGDPSRVLGVVHPGFRPLQNREAVKLFDTLLGKGERHYHTGGHLRTGEIIWLLARLPDEIRIGGEDMVEPYMLFTNSHDGTIAVDMRLTTVRVVCRNTLALAMRRGNSSHVFKRAHRFNAASLAKEAGEFYGMWKAETKTLESEFQRMHTRPFTADSFRRLLERLLPYPRPPARMAMDVALHRRHETAMQKVNEAREGIARVFSSGLSNGITIPPAEETLWGALNSVTAFVDHQQQVRGNRYAYILFGKGAALKRRAFDLALAELSKN
jgi:phage/plasmid-like protein (TIGR03299 family)